MYYLSLYSVHCIMYYLIVGGNSSRLSFSKVTYSSGHELNLHGHCRVVTNAGERLIYSMIGIPFGGNG